MYALTSMCSNFDVSALYCVFRQTFPDCVTPDGSNNFSMLNICQDITGIRDTQGFRLNMSRNEDRCFPLFGDESRVDAPSPSLTIIQTARDEFMRSQTCSLFHSKNIQFSSWFERAQLHGE